MSMLSTDGKEAKNNGSVEDLKKGNFSPFIDWEGWKGEKEEDQEHRRKD